jgi:hypothetical protein
MATDETHEVYLLYGGGAEPFDSFYNCSCGYRIPPSWSRELRPVEPDYRNHFAAKQFAEHIKNDHLGDRLKEPRAGDKVRLPGRDLIYQVTNTENGTAALLPVPPASPQAKEDDVEWRFLIYLEKK